MQKKSYLSGFLLGITLICIAATYRTVSINQDGENNQAITFLNQIKIGNGLYLQITGLSEYTENGGLMFYDKAYAWEGFYVDDFWSKDGTKHTDTDTLVGIPATVTAKMDKVVPSAAGNLGALNISGQLYDTGDKLANYTKTADLTNTFYTETETTGFLNLKVGKVNPAVVGNIVEFSSITGDQQDSGKNIDSYSTTTEIASLYYNESEIVADYLNKIDAANTYYSDTNLKAYFLNEIEVNALIAGFYSEADVTTYFYNRIQTDALLAEYYKESDVDANFYNISEIDSMIGGLSSSLAGLTDVTLTGVAQGDLLYYAGAEWQNIPAGSEGEVLTAHGTANPTWEAATGGHTIKDEGTPLTQRTGLNFTGFVVADDAINDETDISLETTAYTTTFDNGDLTLGVLTVNHALGQKVVHVLIADDSDMMIVPDNITYTDTNNCAVDLSSFGTIANTWTVTVIKAGGSGSGGADTTALHKATSGEIAAMDEKTTLVDDDLFLIEDSEASNAKKKVKKSNLGASGATTWTYITASQTALVSNGYMLYAHDAEIDLTLPATPTIGQSVSVRILDLTEAVWLYSDDNIEGSAEDLQIDTVGFYGEFTYSNAEYGWIRSK